MKPKIEHTAADCENLKEAFHEAKRLAIDNNCNVDLKFDGRKYIITPKTKFKELFNN